MTATLAQVAPTAEVVTKDLIAAVSKAVKVINRNTTVPILSNVLLVSDGEQLTVTATDLEVSVKTTIDCYGEPFEATVAGKNFLEILKGAAETVTLQADGPKLVVASGNGAANLHTLPAEEYPPGIDFTPETTVTVNGKALVDRIKRIVTYPSTEEARGSVLMGALIEVAKGVTFTGTDGYKLGQIDLHTAYDGIKGPDYKGILPARFLKLAAAGIDKKATVTVGLGEKYSTITSGSTKWTVRVVDGQYPNCDLVIPKKFDRQVEITTKPFLTAVQSAEKVAGDRASMVTFEFQRHFVRISASSDISGLFEANVDYHNGDALFGDELKIAFNAKFLIGVIQKGFPDATSFLFSALGPLSPVKISAGGFYPGDIAILMPLRQ